MPTDVIDLSLPQEAFGREGQYITQILADDSAIEADSNRNLAAQVQLNRPSQRYFLDKLGLSDSSAQPQVFLKEARVDSTHQEELSD
jgi:hypothetical protein